MNDEEFTKLIKESHLTVIELADAIMVSKPTIRRWAEGRNLPRPVVREAIVRCLKSKDCDFGL